MSYLLCVYTKNDPPIMQFYKEWHIHYAVTQRMHKERLREGRRDWKVSVLQPI
jgi:hypothetical protein